MKREEAVDEVDRFNATMRSEGVNVSAEWIGGHFPLEITCGWRTMTPASPYRNVEDVRTAIQKTIGILRRWGVVHQVSRVAFMGYRP